MQQKNRKSIGLLAKMATPTQSRVNIIFIEKLKEFGNYFGTKEEAEKAVKKLKAWKRLKDKGFRFKCCDDYHIDYELTGRCVWTDETEADLDLLFGGEE